MVVLAFLLLVGAGLRIAQTARSDFSQLVATGLTIIIGFQAFFIMAGVVRLLPFTGITLPFMAYGGSSLVANYVLMALLMRISDEGASTVRPKRRRAWSSRASGPRADADAAVSRVRQRRPRSPSSRSSTRIGAAHRLAQGQGEAVGGPTGQHSRPRAPMRSISAR